MTDRAIRCRDLQKTYGAGPTRVEALRGIDLEIAAGEAVAITGPSGCGKTSLLNLLGALDHPSAGSLEVFGTELSKLSSRDRALFRRETVGFIFQQFHLIPTLTAAENVALPLRYAGIPKTERVQRANDALERVGLGRRTDHLPAQLSGGEQQRVAIARALGTGARLVLADEPTGNLDQETAQDIIRILLNLPSSGLTLILVTHDDTLAARLGRRIKLRDGRLEQ